MSDDRLHITEHAHLSDRGEILLEAAKVRQEIIVLNMRLDGINYTPKALREERKERLMRERTAKVQKLAELKKRFDAVADSPAGK